MNTDIVNCEIIYMLFFISIMTLKRIYSGHHNNMPSIVTLRGEDMLYL